MKNQKGFTVVELLIALGCLVALALVFGGIYVAVHFIGKFW